MSRKKKVGRPKKTEVGKVTDLPGNQSPDFPGNGESSFPMMEKVGGSSSEDTVGGEDGKIAEYADRLAGSATTGMDQIGTTESPERSQTVEFVQSARDSAIFLFASINGIRSSLLSAPDFPKHIEVQFIESFVAISKKYNLDLMSKYGPELGMVLCLYLMYVDSKPYLIEKAKHDAEAKRGTGAANPSPGKSTVEKFADRAA